MDLQDENDKLRRQLAEAAEEHKGHMEALQHRLQRLAALVEQEIADRTASQQQCLEECSMLRQEREALLRERTQEMVDRAQLLAECSALRLERDALRAKLREVRAVFASAPASAAVCDADRAVN